MSLANYVGENNIQNPHIAASELLKNDIDLNKEFIVLAATIFAFYIWILR